MIQHLRLCGASLTLLQALLQPSVSQAQDFAYTTTSGQVTITGYTGAGEAVTIPDTIDGLPVTTIAGLANRSVTSVMIPDSVTNIGIAAFWSSSSLTTITVDAANPAYSSVDGVLFNMDQTTLVAFPGGRAGNYTIPYSVLSVGVGAFYHSFGLTGITIPDSVTSISGGAFYYCTNLASLTIGNSVTTIGSSAFYSCFSLTGVTIPDSVASIGGEAFDSCSSLTSLRIGSGVTNIGDEAFSDCSSLTDVTIPENVTRIGDFAFLRCSSLAHVTIPNSVTSIRDLTFAACTSLTIVTIPDNLTNIGFMAFFNCSALTEVSLGNGLASIADRAFGNCSNLTGAYFKGNAPGLRATNVFFNADNATVYYLAGTTGWGATYGGRPTMLWYPQVVISTNPQSQTVSKGANVTFTVIATGAEPLRYQWRKGGVGLIGATNSTLILSNVQTNQTDVYDVVITNFAGNVTSTLAVLTVERLTQSITFGPLPRKLVGDAPFALAATASSDLPVSYTSSDLTVATVSGSILTIGGVGSTTITANQDGDATYAAAPPVSQTLTVWGIPPLITAHPLEQTVTEGGTIAFSVTADGTGPLSYQWWFNEAPVAGGISPSLFITNATTNFAGIYFVVVTSVYGSITSSNATLTVLPARAKIRVIAASGVSGVNVVVPIHVTVSTNENALGFSLAYDPAVLSYDSVALGSGSSGGSLIPNTAQASIGELGIAVALPSGVSYASGTQEVVKVTFLARPVTTPTMTLVNFGDQPTPRELVNVQGTVLPATYSGAAVQIAPGTYEADVAPRPNGDHSVGIADWVQVGRFVAGLDSATNQVELQRADCAPRANGGNGNLTVTDWVQAGRYAAGLDPITIVGDTAAGHSLLARGPEASAGASLRVLHVLSTNFWAGQTATACLQMESLGDETAFGTSLSFDSAALRFLSARLGAHAVSSTLNVNTNEAAAGRLGLVLSLPFGTTLARGTRELVMIDFQLAPTTSGAIPLTLNDVPVVREVSDTAANTLPTAYENGAVGVTRLPALDAVLLNQAIKLSWALPSAPFVLQVSGTVGEWSDVVEAPEAEALTLSVTLSLSSTNQFFRLRRN